MIKLKLLERPQGVNGNPLIGFGLHYKNKYDDFRDGSEPRTNARGFESRRPVSEILKNPSDLTIAVVGDSHTNLNEKIIPIDKQHHFVLETLLREKGIDAEVLGAGWPKYSPLQEYLLFKHYLKDDFKPKVLVMNLYTGNDFYDLIRVDDRPHYTMESDGSITIKPPVWITYEDPNGQSSVDKSRIIWAGKKITRTFLGPRIIARLQFLLGSAKGQGAGYIEAFSYMNDVRKSIEPRLHYRGAFSAQILNQALFMKKYFPVTVSRSKMYFRHLLNTIRRENPDMILVLSAIPSAALAERMPKPILFEQTLKRIHMSQEAVISLEQDLYEMARTVAQQEGWIFVDNLKKFKDYDSNEQLFNELDLHVNVKACQIIGEAQASEILSHLN